MDTADISIVYHFGLALTVLWITSSFGYYHPIVYFICFVYLFQVNERYVLKLRKRLRHEEKKQAHQKRLLSDSESVRWLNHLLEKVWPVCMEQVASKRILLPIIPWFLEKYKPWTARKVVMQGLYLGRNPPMVTEMRVLAQSTDDDHLVLELGLNFLSADDMSAILAVQLRKRLGFGMWTKLHITGMHIEGKVLLGIKFKESWPFLQHLRLCFVQPPYFQMTVKPIFSHGLDVTEVPGIAGWLDKVLAVAFEETLVEPNMLVVDVDKLVRSAEGASSEDGWFFVDEKRPVAHAKVEIMEAADMKPSDPNGLADPYVKGNLGPYRFTTKIQRKTLRPKWQEEFKIPISTWDSPNVLEFEIRDKDLFLDDMLGECSISVNDLRGGRRHEKWLPLLNVKTGRLHIAITVFEIDPNAKYGEDAIDQPWDKNGGKIAVDKGMGAEDPDRASTEKIDESVEDKYESINIEGQNDTGISIHQPGTNVSTVWEQRKGRNRNTETVILQEIHGSLASPFPPQSRGTNCSGEEDKSTDKNQNPVDVVKRSFQKMGSIFSGSPKDDMEKSNREVQTPRSNLKAGRYVDRVQVDTPTDIKEHSAGVVEGKDNPVPPRSDASGPGKGNAKDVAKGILKHAGKSMHELKHRLSRKGSSKFKVQSNQNGSDKSDTSVDESTSNLEEYSPKTVYLHADSVTTVQTADSLTAQTPRHTELVIDSSISLGFSQVSNEVEGNGNSVCKVICEQDRGERGR